MQTISDYNLLLKEKTKMRKVIRKFDGLTNQQKQLFLNCFGCDGTSTISDTNVRELYEAWQALSPKERQKVYEHAAKWEDKLIDKLEKIADKFF